MNAYTGIMKLVGLMSVSITVLCILGIPGLAANQSEAGPAGAIKPLTLEIRADQPGHRINKTQYGVFFEEISHAGQGGLYAELVNSRAAGDW